MCCALQELLPHAEYYKRGGFSLKKIVQFASNRDYTDLLVFNEDSKHVSRGPACPCVCVCALGAAGTRVWVVVPACVLSRAASMRCGLGGQNRLTGDMAAAAA